MRLSAFFFLLASLLVFLLDFVFPFKAIAIAPVEQWGATSPDYLSEWDLFYIQNNTLLPGKGVYVYTVETPLFSDYAGKLRTITLPQGETVRVLDDGSIDFPNGTILSKTFYYPRFIAHHKSVNIKESGTGHIVVGREPADKQIVVSLDLTKYVLIETRLLVKRHHQWEPLVYQWPIHSDQAESQRHFQRDARLMMAGALHPMQMVDRGESESFHYSVPDKFQCAECHGGFHKENQIEPLGLYAYQLDTDVLIDSLAEVPEESIAVNQWEHWQRLGLLEELPGKHSRWLINSPGALLKDQSGVEREVVQQKARQYLQANCAHCHNRNGTAQNSGLFLELTENNPYVLGVCRRPTAASSGTFGHDFNIQPGRAEASILYLRMVSRNPQNMMPELGRDLIDQPGSELIRQWIEVMENMDCNQN